MPLLEELPKSLEETLLKEVRREELVAAVATDLNLQGSFGEEWLVITPARIRVYDGNGSGVTPRVDLPLSEVKSANAEGLVGGGALQVRADGKVVELLRYTNAHQNKFSRVAKYLNDCVKHAKDAQKGEAGKQPPKLDPDPEEQRRCPACKLLLPEGTKVCPACLSKGKVLKRLLRYLRPHWKRVFWLWASMLCGLGLGLIPPYLTLPLTDIVMVPREPRPAEERLLLLGWLVLCWLGVRLTGDVIGILRGRVAVTLGTLLSHELRAALFQHLQSLSLKFFDKRQTGALMTRVTRDTQSLEAVLVDGVQHFLSNVLLFFGIGIVLFCLNWKLALLIFIPAPLVFFLSQFFWRRMLNLWRRCWHLHSRMSATVNDVLTGVRVVRAFAKEDREIERFSDRSRELYEAERNADQMRYTFFPMVFFLMSTGQLIVWYVGGRSVIGGEFTFGTLMVFISYLGMFYGPLQWMSNIADYLSRSFAAAERVFEVLDSTPDVPDAKDAKPTPRIEGRVEFKNVTFGYEKHKPVLKEVSFKAAPGEMIGLVGKSGAGKSTTINLVCRFYDPQEGQVLIDGVDLRELRQQDLRSQIGIVLQDTFLFSGTILENIAYAKPDATREEIMTAAKAANAHDFVCQKPDGYDTQVGERGQALSAGERQRISIARAILHDPRILILDEATSSVDTETEKQIQEAIARLVQGRTTFAIAHRLSTLRNASRLLVLKEGKIVEDGTHEELVAKKGEFYRLVNIQQEMSKIIAVVG